LSCAWTGASACCRGTSRRLAAASRPCAPTHATSAGARARGRRAPPKTMVRRRWALATAFSPAGRAPGRAGPTATRLAVEEDLLKCGERVLRSHGVFVAETEVIVRRDHDGDDVIVGHLARAPPKEARGAAGPCGASDAGLLKRTPFSKLGPVFKTSKKVRSAFDRAAGGGQPAAHACAVSSRSFSRPSTIPHHTRGNTLNDTLSYSEPKERRERRRSSSPTRRAMSVQTRGGAHLSLHLRSC
jgi:hypothetical protein